jgi:uncharacterized protein YecE (DUF72 family)
MDFGKLNHLDQVDFSLPPDPEANAHLVKPIAAAKAQLYLGATGYHMPEWVGTWYRPGTKTNQFLSEYGRQLNSLEHNTTYYRIPDAAQVKLWYADTPAHFKFCPKLPQTVSHATSFGENNPDILSFCDSIAGLREKLGLCFLQLPPQFSLNDLPRLERFLQIWPASVPLAVEVRSASYFPKGVQAFLSLLHKYGVYTVITDVAGRRDVCHCGLSGNKVLIRLVGNGMVASDILRLNLWFQKIQHWINLGVTEIYLFCHQPDNLLAPEFCSAALDAAKHCSGLLIPTKPELYRPDAEQLTLF